MFATGPNNVHSRKTFDPALDFDTINGMLFHVIPNRDFVPTVSAQFLEVNALSSYNDARLELNNLDLLLPELWHLGKIYYLTNFPFDRPKTPSLPAFSDITAYTFSLTNQGC